MTANRPNPTIFLSFSPADAEFAREISQLLTQAAVRVWTVDEIDSSGLYTNKVRRALDRSDGVVVALRKVENRKDLSASVLFEIGAASGARKPVFVVVDSLPGSVPFNVPEMHVIPFNRVSEIPTMISALERSAASIRPTG